MKFDSDMYYLNTFNIPKHQDVNKWAGEGGGGGWGGWGRIQKTTRKSLEIKRISTFASSKTNSDNTKKKGDFLLPSITI